MEEYSNSTRFNTLVPLRDFFLRQERGVSFKIRKFLIALFIQTEKFFQLRGIENARQI